MVVFRLVLKSLLQTPRWSAMPPAYLPNNCSCPESVPAGIDGHIARCIASVREKPVGVLRGIGNVEDSVADMPLSCFLSHSGFPGSGERY